MKIRTFLQLVSLLLFWVCPANAMFVEPVNTTLFILLDASGFCNSTESASWKDGNFQAICPLGLFS